MTCFDVMAGFRFCGPLAVVPVFVNTGAALLPAIVAGLASFVAILLQPGQLVRVCREKPYWPLGILAGAARSCALGARKVDRTSAATARVGCTRRRVEVIPAAWSPSAENGTTTHRTPSRCRAGPTTAAGYSEY